MGAGAGIGAGVGMGSAGHGSVGGLDPDGTADGADGR
jgi:hypothetical protein